MKFTLQSDDATVAFSQTDNEYKVGPFKVFYPEEFCGDVMFSGIDKVTLETNLGEMKYEEDWSFAYTDTDAEGKAPNDYPANGHEFYIVLKYKPDMTKITKLHFDFKYVNAGGVWANYSGAMSQCGKTGAYYDYGRKITFPGDFSEVQSIVEAQKFKEVSNESQAQSLSYSYTTHKDSDGNVTGYTVYWRCSNCGASGSYYTSYLYYSSGHKCYNCPTCGRTNVGSSHKCYKCETCGKTKLSESEKNAHKCYKCETCGKYLKTKAAADAHKCYQCNICGDGPMTEAKAKKHNCLTTVHAQNMAVLRRAVRWYTYDEIDWGTDLVETSITVEKTVTDDSKNKVKVDDTFYFDIYIDYQDGKGEKKFETLAVETKDGYGTKTSTSIHWVDGKAPKYRVVERDKDGYSIDGPWSGSLDNYANNTFTIKAENTLDPYKGKIEIDKKFISSTPALESETFTFKVEVTGTFAYGNSAVQTYTSSNPFELTPTINKSNNWEWVSEYFKWYDKDNPPKYKVTEVIADDANYKLVGATGDVGTIIDSEDENTIAIFTNTSTQKENYLHVDKEIIGKSAPEPGEVFYVDVEITGDFKYNGVACTEWKQTIQLDESNNWNWTSEKITWTTDTAPKYKIVESSMPDNYTYVSTTDQSKTSTTNDFNSKLNEGHTYVTINNKLDDGKEGNIRIIKLAETDDIAGKDFKFTLTVTGNFTYNGTLYNATADNPLVITDYIKSVTSASEATVRNNTLKEYKFEWEATEEAPKYIVEENLTEAQIEDGIEFVSISNNTKTVTSEPKIEGQLIDDNIVVIKMLNRGVTTKDTQIQIVKETIGNIAYLDILPDADKTFKFDVTITGTFTYTDSSGNVTVKNNDSLTLEASVIGKGTEDGNSSKNVWISGKIEWNDDVAAPTYKVTEKEIPSYAKFVSWSNRTETVQTKTISGKVSDEQTNVLTAINDIEIVDKKGKISITKKSQTDNISGETFNFTLTVKGDFTYDGQEYTSDGTPLTLNVDVVADGDTWVTEKDFIWKGDNAPTYTVKENLTEAQISDGVELVDINNNSNGSLIEDTTVSVLAVNKKEPKYKQGRIEISKTYIGSDGNEIKDVEFLFQIEITYANGDKTTLPVKVKSGSTYRSGYFYWSSNEAAPTYKVTEIEIPAGVSVKYKNQTGTLSENSVAKVEAENTITSHKGKLSIQKKVEIDDKVSKSDVEGTFTFNVNVTGTFTYNGKTYTNDTMLIQVQVKANGTWTSKDFTWYGNNAPTYSIEETSLPSGWALKEITNSSGELENGKTKTAVCTNRLGPEEVIFLTMEIGGKVWDDTDRTDEKLADAGENGKIDEGESGIEGVKVTVYRVVTDSNGNIKARLNDVYAYDENDKLTRINNYTYTDSNGNWSFGAISVPAYVNDTEKSQYGSYSISYDVEFTYDGQTYEPTTFLENSNGNASSYRSASTSNRDKWALDSMAIDDSNERNAFNSKFTNIEGNTPMDSNGDTLGKATGAGSTTDLHYSSTDTVSLFNSDNTRKVSTLETYDSNGNLYNDLTMNARTSTGALTYPFDSNIHLVSWDKEVTLYGVTKTKYYFSATYNYLKSINLGLIEREYTDVSVEKDLTEAIVVINGKVLKYKYNSSIDLDNPNNYELLYKQIAVADEEIDYTLGLYKSDYYYRASIYNGTEVGNALGTFYGSLGLPVDSTELEIYLKYTINVYNESETYDVTINKLADYYDSTFELITDPDTQSKTYVQTLNGKEVNQTMNLAEGPKVTYYTSSEVDAGNGGSVAGGLTKESGTITGSDGVTYNKLTISALSGRKLATGERAEVNLTFKVKKDVSVDGISNSIKLGEKHNLAEVTSFTSYYSNKSKNKWSTAGQVTGRVDKDSAPDNINIPQLNEKTYYEDDSDSAPILTIELYNTDREVNGLVWNDAETDTIKYSQTVGNGLYNPEEGDKTIPDLTTEIIEEVSVPTGEVDAAGNAIYTEYDFIWPTESTTIDGLAGKSLQELTGFDSTIVTDSNGQYEFTAVPAGNYKVRFVYGDKAIETGNSGYEEVYNGQDYKSTSYQVGFDNDSDDDGYVDNDWHDLSNKDLNTARVSDARDSEARRLYISAKSEMLIYDNTSVLDTADNKDAEHDKLFGDYEGAKAAGSVVTGSGYYMYSETAKLNLEVEATYNMTTTKEDVKGNKLSNDATGILTVDGDIDKGAVSAGNKFTYKVNNIDAGIEERSQTKITLDKQIKEIKLTTSDGKVILDAVYDILYEFGDDDEIKSSVRLNESLSTGYEQIASLNRTDSSQGYRYIMAEGTILQGTTITVNYQLTAFNVGEADTCTQRLENLWETVTAEDGAKWDLVDGNGFTGADQINSILDELTSPRHTATDRLQKGSNDKYQYGTYFGSPYYLGTKGTYRTDGDDNTVLVKSTVHQVIDYVDPDVEFIDTDNISKDQSWSTTTINYLIENGLIDPHAIQIINAETKEPVCETNADGVYSKVTYADRAIRDGEAYSIINDELQEYITETKNNVILNIDNSVDGESGTNPRLVKETVPYTAEENYDDATASIKLQVSRYYSSEEDAAEIDNIAEIIKVENTVGRRDIRTVAGNTSTYELKDNATGPDDTKGLYEIAGEEPDTSATEVITLTPPTGLNTTVSLVLQIVAVVVIAGVIIAVGIVVIKKKVIKK